MFGDDFIVRSFGRRLPCNNEIFVCLVEVMMRKHEACTGELLGRTWTMLVLDLFAHV